MNNDLLKSLSSLVKPVKNIWQMKFDFAFVHFTFKNIQFGC